jgi:prepilin-type N-terminal cleavage/methylation domain-containing protein
MNRLRRHPRHAGFTLVELLIVVAIIAILAAIAITNYFNAVSRARQKRTMADMRTIAQAWEARAAETRTYTAAGFSWPTAMTYDTVRTVLVPTYTKNMPQTDGWGRPFEFGAVGSVYGIRSPGRDGVYEGTDYPTGATENPDCDIVYSGGNFVRWPEIIQGN